MRNFIAMSFVAFAGMTASADTVVATFNTVNPGSNGAFSLDGGANWNGTGPAGLFNWTRTGGDFAGLQGNFYAFCTELTEHVGYGGNYTYTVASLEQAPTALGGMGTAKADAIRELFGRYYNPSFGSVLDTDHAAAMEMSIWEITHETTNVWNLGTGTAQFVNDSANAINLANSMLASLDGTGPKATDLYALIANGVQDMIVPTPGTAVLAGTGLLTLSRRRRQK